MFNMKDYLTTLITNLLTVMKKEINEASISVFGQFIGSATTFDGLPTADQDGNPLQAGDFAVLTVDDGTNEAGMYAYDGSAFALITVIPNMNEMLDTVLATDAESIDPTVAVKALTVKQGFTNFALLGGLATQSFLSLGGTTDTDEVLNANQFATSEILTEVDIQTIYDGITI